MKNYFLIILSAFLSFACNSGKKKTSSTGNSSTTDSINYKEIITKDSIYQTTTVDSPVSVNRLIIPGKTVGLTSIDQKNTEALKHLGPPATEDAGMGKELATWYSKPLVNGNDTIINETNIFFRTNMGSPDEASRVSHIRITSPFFSTAQHVGAGTGLDTIQKYFPGSKKIASYKSAKTKQQVMIYDDSSSGIAFEIDSHHKCVAITVHKTGEKAYETYNALFNDINYF